jgi:protein-tyrosine phosphatase
MTLLWKGLTIVPRRLAEHGLRTTWLWLYEKYARLRDGFSPPETSQVSRHLFVGGQQYRRGLERMRSLGIGATLNLREEADDATSGVAFPRHLWLPTPDDGAPTLPQLQQGVEFIGSAITAGQGVYIHCAQGVGRAPSMAAAYLIREGADPAGALARIRAVRPFITPTPAQVARLEEWTALVRSQRNDHVG